MTFASEFFGEIFFAETFFRRNIFWRRFFSRHFSAKIFQGSFSGKVFRLGSVEFFHFSVTDLLARILRTGQDFAIELISQNQLNPTSNPCQFASCEEQKPTADYGRLWIDPELIWDRFGIDLGSIWRQLFWVSGQFRIDFRVDSGSIWDRLGVG